MTRTRIWTLGTAAVVAVVLAAGWFMLVSPARAEATSVEEQTVSQQAANAQLAMKIEDLKVKSADLPAQEAKLAAFRQTVPAQPDLPSFIRSLSSIADKSNVVLISVEPQAPAALSVPETEAPATTGEDGAAAPGSVTLNTAPPSTVQYVQAQVSVTGGYFNTEQFFTKMEGLDRAFLVTGFDINPDTTPEATPGDVVTNVQVRIFFAPLPVDAASPTPSASATTN